jgi:predicted sulfurtransferase
MQTRQFKYLSFYKYIPIEDPEYVRGRLRKIWFNTDGTPKVFGRVYLAKEGMCNVDALVELYTMYQNI